MTTFSFEQHLEAMIASRETVIKQRERANAEDRDFIRRAKDRLNDLRLTAWERENTPVETPEEE